MAAFSWVNSSSVKAPASRSQAAGISLAAALSAAALSRHRRSVASLTPNSLLISRPLYPSAARSSSTSCRRRMSWTGCAAGASVEPSAGTSTEATQRFGVRAAGDRHRQAGQPPGGAPRAAGSAEHRRSKYFQQSRRELASTHHAARTGDETVQIARVCTTIPVCLLGHLTAFPARPTRTYSTRMSYRDGRPFRGRPGSRRDRCCRLKVNGPAVSCSRLPQTECAAIFFDQRDSALHRRLAANCITCGGRSTRTAPYSTCWSSPAETRWKPNDFSASYSQGWSMSGQTPYERLKQKDGSHCHRRVSVAKLVNTLDWTHPCRLKQQFGVVMLWVIKDSMCGTGLNNTTALHHVDAVTELLHHS